MLGAELHLSNTLTVAREMFGRGYFSLGVGEKALVDLHFSIARAEAACASRQNGAA
jgi:hypothetical protein